MLDIIICANFGVEKLRGLGNTRGQILVFPIEMAGHPYNSAALPRSLWWEYREWDVNIVLYCNHHQTFPVSDHHCPLTATKLHKILLHVQMVVASQNNFHIADSQSRSMMS